MRLLVLIATLIAFPVHAGEMTALDKLLNSLPPMNTQDRAAFDKAAKSMFHRDCSCLSFIHDGVMRKATLPINDSERRLLIEGIKRGFIIPVTSDRAS